MYATTPYHRQHSRHIPLLAVLALLLALTTLRGDSLSSVAINQSGFSVPTWLSRAYGKLPMSFKANQGQTDAQVDFLSRGSGYTLFLTPKEAVLDLKGPNTPTALRMQLVGANPTPDVAGLDELPGKINYLIGTDSSHWYTDVSSYARVKYQDVYPAIDLVYYGNQRQLEYDFILAPGADPGDLRLAFKGTDEITLDAQGNLVLRVEGGEVILNAPVIYQEVVGTRLPISGGYFLHYSAPGEAVNEIGFQIGTYDTSRPLIIDPVLLYSTYLGGASVDQINGIAVDGDGNVYVAGTTSSADFPIEEPAQAGLAGPSDAFIAKLSSDGSALVYATYLGGTAADNANGIAVNSSNEVYIAGATNSADFPTTDPLQATVGGSYDAFVVKLDAAGSAIVYSTYLGGSGLDQALAIAIDDANNTYITGETRSTNFPTASPFQASSGGGFADAFVAKINSTGSALVYSSYLGGNDIETARSIAADSSGNAYVTGNTISTNFPTASPLQGSKSGSGDAFVTKVNPTGSGLVFSTYFGGLGGEVGTGIALDDTDNVHIVGFSSWSGISTSGAAQETFGGTRDAFVTKFNAAGSAVVYSTYVGGSGTEEGRSIALDSSGNAYVIGGTDSGNFPTENPFQAANAGGVDLFVTKINSDGSVFIYSSYLGGSGNDFTTSQSGSHGGIAIDVSGNAYVAGDTGSTDFPTANAFQATSGGSIDAFVAKIGEPPPTPTPTPAPVPGTSLAGLWMMAGVFLVVSLLVWRRRRATRAEHETPRWIRTLS